MHIYSVSCPCCNNGHELIKNKMTVHYDHGCQETDFNFVYYPYVIHH